MSLLPDYIVADVNNLEVVEKTTIRTVAKPLTFPLTEQDKKDISLLVSKYDNETGIAGLAAPQIGISKRAIIFEAQDDYEDEKPFPRSIWINPSYKNVDNKMTTEYEQCFSVSGMTGPVKRYKRIYYEAYNMDGKQVKGMAEGYAARIIQHETDHLNGILFVDLVPKGKLITIEQYLLING